MDVRSSAEVADPSRDFKILLVEDDIINQKLALAILESAGYQVDIAENGRLAVDAVGRTDYDLVLMDLQMPELNGLQATRQIRALPPPKCNVRIGALTASRFIGDKEECIAAGMNDYVAKPLTVDLLWKTVEEAKRVLPLMHYD